MADNNEEEYLNELLMNLLNETGDDTPQNADEPEKQNNEIDDDLAELNKLLANDSGIYDDGDSDATSDSITEEFDGMDDILSIDSLLEEARLEEEQDPVISPIIDDSMADDFFGDLQGIVDSSSGEDSRVDEAELRKSFIEQEELKAKEAEKAAEMADLLSLEEGMTLEDIPDDSNDSKLTEDELSKISGIMNETSSDEEPASKKSKKKREKKAKTKKEKKSKKQDVSVDSENSQDVNEEQKASDTVAEEKVKKPKKEKVKKEKAKKEKVKKEKIKKEKPKKEKKKASFKDFISNFEDEEDDTPNESDKNQKLIDELYDGTKESDEEFPKKEKKPKKEKPKREKKVKEPKVKKPKEDKGPVERVQIGKGGVAVIAILVLVFILGGFFGVRYVNYRLTINSAKEYYELRNYSMAYEKVSGLDIMDKDLHFYGQIHTIMIINQGIDSYNNYIELGKQTQALDALINAVGRKQFVAKQAEQYNVTDKVNVVYQNVLSILEQYGIDEEKALDLYVMSDYNQYYDILEGFIGVTE